MIDGVLSSRFDQYAPANAAEQENKGRLLADALDMTRPAIAMLASADVLDLGPAFCVNTHA